MIEVVVCIATRRRPAGLAELLRSLVQQDLPADVSMRVVVVENDDQPDPAVKRAVADLSLDLELLLESRQGIPYARNMAVSRARGADLIAFLDDDEVAPPSWLRTHLSALGRYEADVTTGPVLPKFAQDPPSWAVPSGLFHRKRWPTGHRRDVAYTGNAVCHAALLTSMSEPFDTRLALTGGSDTQLFTHLVSSEGARIVWVDEAPVFETVPPERTTLSWVIRRGLRYGGDRWRRRQLASTDGLLPRLTTTGIGMAELAIGTVLAIGVLPFSKGLSVRWLNRAARGVGAIAEVLGLRFHEYATSPPSLGGRRWHRQ